MISYVNSWQDFIKISEVVLMSRVVANTSVSNAIGMVFPNFISTCARTRV
jgi:hypothetical protein